jgi:hypothetical protein
MSGFIRFIACICTALVAWTYDHGTAAEVLPSRRQQPLFAEGLATVPQAWRPRPITGGRDFLPVVYYSSFKQTVETPDGPKPFSDQPWARQAIVRVLVDELRDPKVYADLLERHANPIMVFGTGSYLETVLYPGKTPEQVDEYVAFVKKARDDFGSRFLCVDYGEWTWGGVAYDKPMRELPVSCELLGIPVPKTLDEAATWFERRYHMPFKRLEDAGIPVLSFNCTTLNHAEVRHGSNLTGNEIAYVNAALDGTFLAFCRGAARQFGVPWGSYAASFGSFFGTDNYMVRSPDERRPGHAAYAGRHGHLYTPFGAVPVAETRRTLYSVFMAGGNFLIKESDSSRGMLAGYDSRTIDRTDPRIVALQEETKVFVGPYAQMVAELWDTVTTRRDRGVPYTPIAVLLDRNHGFVFKYSEKLALGAIPYTPVEEQIRATFNTIFPHAESQYAAGPFGEIFDVITTDASPEVLGSYRAVVLAGKPRIDAAMAGQLRAFVESGGVVFLCCEQLTPELAALAGVVDTGEKGSDTSFLRADDFYVFEHPQFTFHKVRLDGAEPLYVAGKYGQREWPVATIRTVGKGRVIVGTPEWLRAMEQPAKMHRVFSEVVGTMAGELAPVEVVGSEVKVMHNRNAGGWVVTLMNNRGTTIAYPGYRPAVRSADTAAVVLRPRFPCRKAVEWTTDRELPCTPEDGVAVVVPPGEIRIVELTTE